MSKSVFSIFAKNRTPNSVTAQIVFVVIAFLVMAVSSIIFTSRIERNHLVREAETALALAESGIMKNLTEPEAFLRGFSDTIRSMILYGESKEKVSDYFINIPDNSFNENDSSVTLFNTHGFFHAWGDEYIPGKNRTHPAEYVPQISGWYTAAIAAAGNVAFTEPFLDPATSGIIMTFSRYLQKDNGDPLAIICIDIDLSRIFRDAININLTEHSYGVVMNSKLEIIAHPERFLIGNRIHNIDSGLRVFADDLERGINVSGGRARNYMYENSIVFFEKIKFGLWLGVVIPINEYNRNINHVAAFIIILGIVLSVILSLMIYQIAQAKKKSDIKTQQKSNFLATMSHEIRTPLNAIMGLTEIQMQNAAHPPSTSEAFIKINNSGGLLLSIINDILDLSKIETGKLDLTPVKYEVASLINDIVQLNYIRYESKPIEFRIDVDANTPSNLVGDELRIKQILNNLLSNAFKYTDKGTVTLSVSAECVGRGGNVLVTLIFQIIDTGQGMTPEQVNRLFDDYNRFDMEANRSTEGAGLGMTITQNLLDLMHGKITIKSAVGEGTAITLRIPQKTEGVGISGIIGKELAENLRQFKLGNAVQIKKAQITHEHMPYGRVLIVDDVETNLYVAKGLMTPYGLNIDLASSGYEAIEKVKQGFTYDIIFMDHMMPKLDGIETTKLIRESGYKSPIVALTANAIAGQAEVFLKNGFDGFISKPIDIRQLNIYLNKLIRDKQSSEVIEAAQREKTELDKNNASPAAVQPAQQQVDAQLAAIFTRDAEKAIGVLETILQKNFKSESDIQLYVINVHAMKSALANVGKTELSGTALRLEQAGREKDINVMTAETHKFLDSLRLVINDLKPKDEEDTGIEDTEEALVFLREKLVVIKDACAEFDKKKVKNTLNELKEKTWSAKTRELMNSIADHLLHSEFDEVANLAEGYIRTIE
jgi:signal transduction histidine kinase/CheY-like chemotaxis protein